MANRFIQSLQGQAKGQRPSGGSVSVSGGGAPSSNRFIQSLQGQGQVQGVSDTPIQISRPSVGGGGGVDPGSTPAKVGFVESAKRVLTGVGEGTKRVLTVVGEGTKQLFTSARDIIVNEYKKEKRELQEFKDKAKPGDYKKMGWEFARDYLSVGMLEKEKENKETKLRTLVEKKDKTKTEIIRMNNYVSTLNKIGETLQMSPEERVKNHVFIQQIALGRTGAGLVSGVLGVGSQLLSAAQWVADKAKKGGERNKVSYLSEEGAKRLNQWADDIKVTNPEMSDQIIQGVGSTIPFYVTGAFIGPMASGLAKISPKVGKLLGITAAAFLESGTEAGGAYQENLEQGKSREEADDAADRVFAGNILFNATTNKFGLFNDAEGVKKIFVSAGGEGVQEAYQQMITNVNTGKEWDEGMAESGVFGAMIGGMITSVDIDPTVEMNKADMKKLEEIAIGTAEVKPQEVVEPAVKPEVKPEVEAKPAVEGVVKPEEGGAVVIDPDEFKKQANDFDPKNHPKYREKAQQQYDQELKTNPNNTVKFTAGGSGSGKSEILLDTMSKDFDGIIVDGTFAREGAAVSKINQAIEAGKDIEIDAILPDIEKAWGFAERRGDRTGRKIPMDEFIRMHIGFVETIKNLANNNPDIDIKLKDIRGIESLTDAKKADFITDNKQIFDTLNKVSYDKTELKKRLTDVSKQRLSTIEAKPRQEEKVPAKGEARKQRVEGKPRVSEKLVQESRPPTEKVKPTLEQDPQKKFTKEGVEKKPVVKKGKGAIFDRVYEQMKLETNVEDNFDSIALKDQAKKATNYMEKNPEDAIKVSLRQKAPPKGVRFESINIATSKQALANGKYQMYSDLVATRSIIQSRNAQGLGLERLVNSLSTDTFVQEVLRSRIQKLSTKAGFKAKFSGAFKKGGKIKLGLDILSDTATAAKQKIDNKVKAKIASAQSIIDALTC